jgi:hypothetical protein
MVAKQLRKGKPTIACEDVYPAYETSRAKALDILNQ